MSDNTSRALESHTDKLSYIKHFNNKRFLFISLFFIFLNILLFAPFFTDSIYFLDDLEFHLNRINSLSDCFENGNFIPMIYSSTLNGYGYANGIFYPIQSRILPAQRSSWEMNTTLKD